MMFDSINAISNAKNLEDKFQFEINNLISQNKALMYEKTDLDQQVSQLVKEKDTLRLEVKDMVDAKNRLENEKLNLSFQFKTTTAKL